MSLFLLYFLVLSAHASVPDSMEYKQFFYPDGKISSEGYMRNGQPDGIWKTYDKEGRLLSQGARKNFELDGIWRFYENENLASEISYKNGKKDGKSILYTNNARGERIEENYLQNELNGPKRIYIYDSLLIKHTPYLKGLPHGIEKEYDPKTHQVNTITKYRNGLVMARESLNRYDSRGLKTGIWKAFYPKDILQWEVPYENGEKHGYYKEYDTLGNILRIEKYERGKWIQDAPELARLELKEEYYANGNLKISVPYKNGLPEGVCRLYDSVSGKVIKSFFFKEGIVTSEGIIDESGHYQGLWTEVYPDGSIKSKGNFRRGKKQGVWTFFYPNGEKIQEGEYKNGALEGQWTWYYPDGSPKKIENYFDGKQDGESIEYNEEGKMIAQGSYIEGLEEGKWIYLQEGEKVEAYYHAGEPHGLWKSYWQEKGKKLSFRGKYIDGQADGKHYKYWPNGSLREENQYRMGKRVGTWRKFSQNGELEVSITHDKNEEEDRYNHVKTDR